MKYMHINLNEILVMICLFLEYKLFYFIALPGTYGAQTNTILVWGGSIILFMIHFVFNQGKLSGYFTKTIFYILLLYLIELVFTWIRYPEEPLLNAILTMSPIFALFSYFIFATASRGNLKHFLKIITLLGVFAAGLLLFQRIIGDNFNIFVLNVYGYNYGRNLLRRGVKKRLIGSSLIDFTGYISVGIVNSNFYKEDKKTLFILNIIVVLLYEIFASNVRANVIIMFAEIFFFLILKKKKSFLIKTLLFLIGIFLMFFTGEQLYLIFLRLQTEYSYYHRVDTMRFYLDRFKASPIFGNGLLKDQPISNINYQLVHGYLGNYGYNDVGIIGLLGKMGILGVATYFAYFANVIKALMLSKSHIILSIFIASALSLVTLSLFDSGRLLVLVLNMAIIDGCICSENLKSR